MKRLIIEACAFILLIAIASSSIYWASSHGYSQGYANGRNDGYADGRKAGYKDGYAKGQSDTQVANGSNYASGYADGQSDELSAIQTWMINIGCQRTSSGYVQFKIYQNYQLKLSTACIVSTY